MPESEFDTPRTLHLSAMALVGLVLTMIFIASIAKVEIVARGTGKVVPVGRVRVLQSEVDGSVANIHVKEGQRVEQAQVMVELNNQAQFTRLSSLRKLEARLLIQKTRVRSLLSAFATADPADDDFIAKGFEYYHSGTEQRSDYVDQQLEQLKAELFDFRNRTVSTDSKLSTNAHRVDWLIEKVDRAAKLARLKQQEFEKIETLHGSRAVSHSAYLKEQRQLLEIESQVSDLRNELLEAMAVGEELHVSRRADIAAWNNDLQQTLVGIADDIYQLQDDIALAEQNLGKMHLRSSTAGTVENLDVFTIGEFVEAGRTLLHIIPSASSPEFEVVFPNEGFGFLAIGQDARIKLDAFPMERYGAIGGQVVDVSSDAIPIEGGGWGFVATVKPDTPYLPINGTKQELVSGMTGEVDVVTGNRALITYFFDPVVKAIQGSLRER